jgi:hypothetical protein
VGRVSVTILASPVLVSFTALKLPLELRPPPLLSLDLAQPERSRETNLPAVLIAVRMAPQLASVSVSSTSAGMGVVALVPPLAPLR